MEVRDLWPQTLVDMGAFREGHLLIRLLRVLEKFLYHRAERIIILLPRADEYIAGLGIDPDRIRWIPNGVNLSQFSVQKPQALANGQFTVMYVGNHGRNALKTLLDSAKVVQSRGCSDIQFVLIGDGHEKPRLMAYGEQLGLVNTEFRDPIPKAQVPAALQTADVLVSVLRDLTLYKYGISLNKLFDYLAAGKPVILTGNPLNNIVKEAQCGLLAPPNDPDALAGAVINLYKMPSEERKSMGKRGRAYVSRHHDYEVLARRLQQVIEELFDDAGGKNSACNQAPG